jgi:hypothetical protein
VARDAREVFVDRVKAIDPLFRRGNLKAFWPKLRRLMELGPDREDVSKKKSHYLTSLAARSLARGDPHSAREFLDLADRSINPGHLTPFLVEERRDFREMTKAALASTERSRRRDGP